MFVRSRIRIFTVTAFAAFLAVTFAPAQDGVPDDAPFVVVCPVEDMIDDGVNVLIRRAVREAKDAEAIIFVVDTPGGRVDSAIEITEAILEAPCPTIAYVRGMGAISAGALISYSCKDIVMAPATNIGAAQVVTVSPEGTMMPTGEKETSFFRSKMSSLAEHNGHNPDIALAMVDKDIELKAYPDEDGKYHVVATNRGQSGPSEDRDESDSADEGVAERVIDGMESDSPVPLGPLKDAVRELSRAQAESEAAKEAAPIDSDAETRGYDVNEDGSYTLLASGKLLTFTSKEALRYGVVDSIESSIDDVKARFGYSEAVTQTIVPTWSEELYRWVTSPLVSTLLLMLGMGGLYMEIRTPGFGMFGVVGITCLTIFFGSRYIVGLSDWVDLLLIGVGVGLLAIEIFLLPGFGIFGISGIVCILAGFFMAMSYTDFTIPQYSWEFDRMRDAGITMAFALILFAVFSYLTARLLPYTPMYRLLVLGGEQDVELGYVSPTESEGTSVVGLEGVSTSTLRPSGKARFGDKTYRVVSRGEYIETGTPVVIVQEEGTRFVVERKKESA